MPREGAARVRGGIDDAPEVGGWAAPDLSVLRLNRRPPPPLPLHVFGPSWGSWIAAAAEASECPLDYVMGPLLASISTLVGNVRWAMATPGWSEPPHLWVGAVGESRAGKSSGADCLMRDVLPKIEAKMAADFPDQLREWRAAAEMHSARDDAWKAEVRRQGGKTAALGATCFAIARAPTASAAPERYDDREDCGAARHRRAERAARNTRRACGVALRD